MSFFLEQTDPGPVILKSTLIPVPHGFTTRYGGVSEGIWESLNLGENRGDEPVSVMENYRRLGQALGFDGLSMAFTRQVHKNEVRIVTDADRRAPFDALPYEADGIVTGERGLPLICFTADCVPVLLCDAENGVIGAVHCGWRSSVADILGEALEKMRSLGAVPARMHAAIGPAIGACCFETDYDVPEAILQWLGPAGGRFFRPEPGAEGKWLVDLRAANRFRLTQLGLAEDAIDVSFDCTVCKSDQYWSHRVTRGERGSQAAVICLPE